MARIYLVDTLFHIHRAFHALPPIPAPDGTPTQAVRGLVSILANLWKSERICHLACAFESPGSNLRSQQFPDYKATRPPAPPELAVQIPLAQEACRCLGIPSFCHEPYEADDILASLAVRAVQAGHEVVIVSNDKDLAQLCVYPQVQLLRLQGQGKKATLEYLNGQAVERLFGVGPELIPSWLALNGDSADNIPGIPRIGPKTACKLLQQLGPLPQLLDRLSEAGRWQTLLEQHRGQLELNLQLATLHQDIPLDFSLEAVTPGDFRELEEFYRRLGMKRFLEPFEGTLFLPQNVQQLW